MQRVFKTSDPQWDDCYNMACLNIQESFTTPYIEQLFWEQLMFIAFLLSFSEIDACGNVIAFVVNGNQLIK